MSNVPVAVFAQVSVAVKVRVDVVPDKAAIDKPADVWRSPVQENKWTPNYRTYTKYNNSSCEGNTLSRIIFKLNLEYTLLSFGKWIEYTCTSCHNVTPTNIMKLFVKVKNNAVIGQGKTHNV